MQQVCCRICAKIISTSFLPGDGETCGTECNKELEWRKELALANSPYRPRKKVRFLRIAELDPVEELDSAIEDLKSIPDLIIDRYLIPKEAYHVFAANPPPIGLDFPIVTMEGDWEGDHGTKARVFGLVRVKALLQELVVSSFAVTRKMDRSIAKLAKTEFDDPSI